MNKVHAHPIRSLRGTLRLAQPGLIAAAVALSMLPLSLSAGQAARVDSAASAADEQRKDVVVDSAAANAAGPTGQELPWSSPLHDVATGGALNDLALALMRQRSTSEGSAQRNNAVSPLSIASALGMLHAATAGQTASELAGVLSGTASGDVVFRERLPSMLDRLSANRGGPLTQANRVWLDAQLVSAVPAAYAAVVSSRFDAGGSLVDFSQPEVARKAINQWVSGTTKGLIPELMTSGSLSPTTKLVVTNALHFRSKWDIPFDKSLTKNRPFQLGDGSVKQVSTMSDERTVRQGKLNGVTVLELPFDKGTYVLLLAMAPEGHSLDALEKSVTGLDIGAWSGALKPAVCKLSLPRFAIKGQAVALKPALQQLGVQSAFNSSADFTPLLGTKSKGISIAEVFHSATFEIDEAGGEASAATAAVGYVKSFLPPTGSCAVDRPFLYAVMHKATQVPVVVGKVADPSMR